MKKLIMLWLLYANCYQLFAQNTPLNPATERSYLLQNVKEVPAIGTWGELILLNNSFPILVNAQGAREAIVGGAMMGKGKVVAFGHDGFFDKEGLKNTQTKQLINNAIRWTANKKDKPVILIRGLDVLADYLVTQGFSLQKINNETVLSAELLNTVDVIILNPDRLKTENNEIEILKKALKSGKGGLFAGLGWGWQQLNPNLSLKDDFKGNILLADAGIEWGEEASYAKKVVADVELEGIFSYTDAKKYVLANNLAQADKKKFGSALKKLMQVLPAIIQNEKPFVIPSDFPGNAPANTPTVTKNVTINTQIPYWHCTGLYAPAGAMITLITQNNIKTGKYKVRIGSHTDKLYEVKENWQRVPEVSLAFSLQKGTTQVFNPFGGMIYIEVPEKNQENIKLNISISGAIEAPFFKLGQTSIEDWRSKIRNFSAPWAEIEGENFAFTIESEYIRNLNNPQEVAQFWDKIQAANRELVAWKTDKPHKMRLVFDRQISLGYMHSGYPIMALTGKAYADEQASIIDIKNPKKWGFVHELGHNHQESAWTFDGTVEVTCNLFSMFALEKVMNLKQEEMIDALTPTETKKMWDEYTKSGKSFEKWKKEPFIALIMYQQLINYYGWENLKKVFKVYRNMPEKELPKDNKSKMDTWLKTYSNVVGEDLSDFFDIWNLPVSMDAKNSLKNLPKANTKKIMGF
ncbi:hypothetical protein AD998_18440 [bacterium 336/3]|nr:hypothetical protein AD998_18440 [bacterium 336/3]